jgi:glutamate-1-semialdehyde aminotransferase
VTGGARAEPAYAAECLGHNFPAAMPADTLRIAYVEVANRSDRAWLREHPRGEAIDLAFFVDETLVTTIPLPEATLEPGRHAVISFRWRSPAALGKHRVKLDMVEQNVAFFSTHAPPLAEFDVEITAQQATESERLMEIALHRNYAFYVPTQGIHWSASGPRYPLFVRTAHGPRFHDAENREFIDYVMGWGASFLGYAHPAINAAVAKSLGDGALHTLPHMLEMEVSEALCERIPCAEMVLFGKNGSDATTAAVRLARYATGRTTVLQSGFHGWQDWNTPLLGNRPPVHRFAYGDVEQVRALVAEHGDVAAIVVEPAAQVEGVDGPVRAADAAFLGDLRALCDRSGAALIFDEIWTGFRYPDGSVQRHTGVIPDLACFGKALSNGFPLAAVVGKREIFAAAVHLIQYTPTFKGEIQAFAAARAALAIYDDPAVAAGAWAYGARLMRAITELARSLGVPARVVGLPMRMVLAFEIEDPGLRRLARTLAAQELLHGGVLCFRGFMLPSASHGEREFEETLTAYGRALTAVARALERGSFAADLEIPEVV